MNFYDNINNVFIKYVGNKVDQKLYEHTLRVAANSSKIADSLLLKELDKRLAYIIAIVCELGKYKDTETINLLIEQKAIRNFIKEEIYDDIIRDVVYSFESNITPDYFPENIRMQIKILNDAHKLDLLYMDSLSIEPITEWKVSSNIISSFSNYKECDKKDIHTSLDNIITRISYIFSLNDKYSFYVVEQEKYIDKIINNLNITDQTIINLFDQLKIIVTKYIKTKIGETYHGW